MAHREEEQGTRRRPPGTSRREAPSTTGDVAKGTAEDQERGNCGATIESPMDTVLIQAKLRSPSLRRAIVSRPRLVEMLATSDAPMGVVVAPPGFGKTTLLVQWQASEERPFAWLSLDDGDNDPIGFWSVLSRRSLVSFRTSPAPWCLP
jgi:hypothetical protein